MTMQHEDDRLGRVAYEAYATNTGGKSLASGDDLPAWDQLADVYRTAWIATAREVIANMAADDEAAMTVPEPEDEGDEAPVS
jgi:hypothetical protein